MQFFQIYFFFLISVLSFAAYHRELASVCAQDIATWNDDDGCDEDYKGNLKYDGDPPLMVSSA